MQTKLNAISGDQSGRKTCLIVRKFACQPPLFALVRRASQLARTPVSRTFNSRLVRGAAPPPYTRARMISGPFFSPAIPAPRGVLPACAAGGDQPKCLKSATFSGRAEPSLFSVWPAGRRRWRSRKNQQLTRTGSPSTKATGRASNAVNAVANLPILLYHEVSR